MRAEYEYDVYEYSTASIRAATLPTAETAGPTLELDAPSLKLKQPPPQDVLVLVFYLSLFCISITLSLGLPLIGPLHISIDY